MSINLFGPSANHPFPSTSTFTEICNKISKLLCESNRELPPQWPIKDFTERVIGGQEGVVCFSSGHNHPLHFICCR